MLRNKLLTGIAVLAIFQPAFPGSSLADYKPGFYTGIQAGYGKLDEGKGPEDFADQMLDTLGTPKSKEKNEINFGGKLFVGYSFNPYFSVDAGFALYPSVKHKAQAKSPTTGQNIYEFDIDFYAIDLMAKAILPLENIYSSLAGWSIYGKLGPAFAIASYKVKAISDTSDYDSKKTVYSIRPSYAIGISYDFTSKFSMDLSWGGIYSRDKISLLNVGSGVDRVDYENQIPSANLIMLGITYKFN